MTTLDKLMYRPGEVFGRGKPIPVSKAAGYELLRTGTLSSLRIGRSILIPAEAIRTWIESAVIGKAGGAA